jgi:hypothetical protein
MQLIGFSLVDCTFDVPMSTRRALHDPKARTWFADLLHVYGAGTLSHRGTRAAWTSPLSEPDAAAAGLMQPQGCNSSG